MEEAVDFEIYVSDLEGQVVDSFFKGKAWSGLFASHVR